MLEFEEVKMITSEEEVVGEIVDEMDITEELIQLIKKSQILVLGWTEVRKVNDFLKVELGDEVLTIGGADSGKSWSDPQNRARNSHQELPSGSPRVRFSHDSRRLHL